MTNIVYTRTDEAPALATVSLLPVISAFASKADISLELKDISLAARIISQFPEYLTEDQRLDDALAQLGHLVKQADANVIKLPNISASVPQIHAAVAELQAKGYALPDYPDEPKNDEQREIRARYDGVKGSAVNPVLREGNSDRRAPAAVKNYAKKHPHSMGAWPADSKTHVASMSEGDFFGTEQSITLKKDGNLSIVFQAADGSKTVLTQGIALQAGEILDSAVMSASSLRSFLEAEIADAKKQNLLFSIHLKATMMKVSDPIMFGHAVKTYFHRLFETFGSELEQAGVNANHGIGALLQKVEALGEQKAGQIRQIIQDIIDEGPDLAMVDSDRGITGLHVPSDVIIDASMPAAIRSGGIMWDKNGNARQMKACIPDRSYAGVYQAVIEDCKANGAFDPASMGSVSNVGLMAQKAEEYGSHDKTFEISAAGTVLALDESGDVLMQQPVQTGDIFRMCQAKDAPIRDWVSLAVERSRATGNPAVFWLDVRRPHDAQVIKKVELYLPELHTDGLEILIMAPEEATRYSLERIRRGLDTISVTGNVLRDYLTDLFPIMELGTSAKMLSIVPLMNGGGLFETGAGGSAPKHVQQFVKEAHLRWDSLGEFLALAVSFEKAAKQANNPKAGILASTLDKATETLLDREKSPKRKAGELDNRGSHFYLAQFWAKELADQKDDEKLAAIFKPLAKSLADSEETILAELNGSQGKPADIGGYYWPDDAKTAAAMRPSACFNQIIDSFAR